MKNVIVSSLGAGAVLAALLTACRAQGPQPAQTAPTKGRVLVLDNERTLTGDIERIGEQYRVKRLIGETWVPAAKALRLCASLEEAHTYLRGRANLGDPDERVRLGEWCRQHGLREQAVAELKAAVQMRPGDEHIRRVLTHLEQAKPRGPSAPPVRPTEKALPRVEVTAESLGLFASKVQPILMNACASCHTGGRGGNFQLTRVHGSPSSSLRSQEQNLSATLAQVDVRQPELSKLLLKALSIHGPGMTQAPLKGRQAPAYRTLEKWVTQTLAANPQLRQTLPAATATAAAGLPPAPMPPGNSGEFGADYKAPKQPAPKEPTPPPPPAAPKAESNDPVDPDGFNRTFHPARKAEGRPPK
jgi:hypothetical protein